MYFLVHFIDHTVDFRHGFSVDVKDKVGNVHLLHGIEFFHHFRIVQIKAQNILLSVLRCKDFGYGNTQISCRKRNIRLRNIFLQIGIYHRVVVFFHRMIGSRRRGIIDQVVFDVVFFTEADGIADLNTVVIKNICTFNVAKRPGDLKQFAVEFVRIYGGELVDARSNQLIDLLVFFLFRFCFCAYLTVKVLNNGLNAGISLFDGFKLRSVWF